MKRLIALAALLLVPAGIHAARQATSAPAAAPPPRTPGSRAVRLVVDTGIHRHRWTRERAIEYFLANALLSRRDAAKEVERYFNNPGQATSYMIGQLRILELRDRARAALGNRFDIRDFHAVVLENGSVPLDVLEELVDAWIAQTRSP